MSGLASARWTSWSPPAVSERAKGFAPILFGFVAKVEDHDTANKARDSSMRCTSMLPDATVEACE